MLESSSIVMGVKIAGIISKGEELLALILGLDGESLGLADGCVDLVERGKRVELVGEELGCRARLKRVGMIVVMLLV